MVVKKKLEPLDGVIKVSVNTLGRLAYITHFEHKITAVEMVDILNEAHLGASIVTLNRKGEAEQETVSKTYLLFVFVLLVLFIIACVGES